MMYVDLIDQDDFCECLQVLGFSVLLDLILEQVCEYVVCGFSLECVQVLWWLVEDMFGGYVMLFLVVCEVIFW